ncbi:MAG: peptidylprolyl isomerase [Chthoniobacterales bacterium]
MKTLLLSLAVLSAISLRAADVKPPSEPAKTPASEVAVIKTTDGTMVVAFWPDVAPNTVANFIKLAKSGFYNGTAFHRIIPGFMIQGGDPLTKDPSKEFMWGTGDPGYKIKAEFSDKKHVRGVISMARGQDVDSAGSQFFLMLGNAPSLDGQYTCFGQLIKGDDVLTKISKTPIIDNGHDEVSKPTKRVEIESIKIVPGDK